jgi:hypothetical protein
MAPRNRLHHYTSRLYISSIFTFGFVTPTPSRDRGVLIFVKKVYRLSYPSPIPINLTMQSKTRPFVHQSWPHLFILDHACTAGNACPLPPFVQILPTGPCPCNLTNTSRMPLILIQTSLTLTAVNVPCCHFFSLCAYTDIHAR